MPPPNDKPTIEEVQAALEKAKEAWGSYCDAVGSLEELVAAFGGTDLVEIESNELDQYPDAQGLVDVIRQREGARE
jgi:hypothetical protein